MAFMAASGVKSLLAIKIKARHDGYTDQISRIFVAKVFVVSGLVMGIDWFHDTVSCIMPEKSNLKESYVRSACWIQGFYIYPELEYNMKASFHYGIPSALEVDGMINGSYRVCSTKDKFHGRLKHCRPLIKQYFNQYQWIPFFIATMSIFFYLPYILFRLVNTDIISLRGDLKSTDAVVAKNIISNYFDYTINSKQKMRWRILFNFLIKCCYVAVNVLAFHTLNMFLNSEFVTYGQGWLGWSAENSSYRLNFDARTSPTPGNKMLPTFGMCDINEAMANRVHSYGNKHKLICEISSNILYQYIFFVIWLVLVISILISIIGVLLFVVMHVLSISCLHKNKMSAKYIYKFLTLREREYLEHLRRENLKIYGDVIRILRQTNLPDLAEHYGDSPCDAMLEEGLYSMSDVESNPNRSDNTSIEHTEIQIEYNDNNNHNNKRYRTESFKDKVNFFRKKDDNHKGHHRRPINAKNGKVPI